jgi:hypothetical protein
MAEEALLRHLCTDLSTDHQTKPDLEERLRELISEQVEFHGLDDSEANAVVTAISRLRILDPACGSGAFPMVLLQLLVHVLRKLDKDNVRDVPLSQQTPIVALVDEILIAKRINPNADLTALEADLNGRIAALYGLTPREIRSVEELVQSSGRCPQLAP